MILQRLFYDLALKYYIFLVSDVPYEQTFLTYLGSLPEVLYIIKIFKYKIMFIYCCLDRFVLKYTLYCT